MTPKTIILFLINAIGNPLMLFVVAVVSDILSLGVTKQLSTNTYGIKFLLYLPMSLILYCLWNLIFYFIFHQRHPDLTILPLLENKYTWWSLIPCGVGIFTLYLYCTEGIESNVFAFGFALPLLASFITQLVFFILWVKRSW